MKTQLSIRLHGIPVGILEQRPTGKKIFTYDKNATMAISLGMPIREEPYDDLACEAFFGGLLPESELAKKLIGKRYGVSPNNTFALLRAIGFDCAGAISCHTMDEPVIPHTAIPLRGRMMTEEELYRRIQALPKMPLFMDVEGLRLSLAGVQDKAAVCLIDDQLFFPEAGCPTTHILKPASSHFEGMVENEYFCLKIAKQLGLPVPDIQLRKAQNIVFLLIERYDRQISNQCVLRIHQEDFCQAMGIPSFKKYQNEGGPGFKACFELLKQVTNPAVDRNQLVLGLVFNYLIGNRDAHGKNFSLLHETATNTRLAPFYDMLCTSVYPELTSKMAMKIGSQYDAKKVLPRHWEALCQDINYRYLAMKKVMEALSQRLLDAAKKEKESLYLQNIKHPIFEKIIHTLETQIRRFLKA